MLTSGKNNGPTVNDIGHVYWIISAPDIDNQHSYHVIKNNSQAKIDDNEQEIIIKSMNYDALIYHENIYDTIVTLIFKT